MSSKKRRNRSNLPSRQGNQNVSTANGTTVDVVPSGTAQAYAQIFEVHHEGPVPAPQILDAYERLVPGAAKRIMDWAEDDLRHSREMEKNLLTVVSTERRRGQLCAVVVCVAAFVAAGYCAFVGATTAAGIIGGTTVVGLVIAFLGGRTQKANKPA